MRHLRFDVLLAVGIFIYLLSPVLSSYEPEPHHYTSHHHTPHVAGHGHGGQGWNAQTGSYYHYHVPLVGQQQYHHPPEPHSDKHILWLLALIPLALLAALPLLFLKLLPLFLIPTGLALLALLIPPLLMLAMMMMGGMAMMPMMMMGMMMMMMMMMGGGMMMMPPMKRDLSGMMFDADGISQQMKTIGELLFGDMNQILDRYSRSLDLDKCPERISCEIGSALFPANASRTSTARSFMHYVLDNAVPATGKTRYWLTNCGEALFTGSDSNNCASYHCRPTFKLYPDSDAGYQQGYQNHGTPKQQHVPVLAAAAASSTSTAAFVPKPNSLKKRTKFKTTASTTAASIVQDYLQQQYNNNTNNPTSGIPSDTKSDRISSFPYQYYDSAVQDNELRSNQLYSRFGTQVVRV